ncbi:MAG TPA: GspH/FimT family pseudopilin [Gemmatimonadaceae bacterium]|nr:GspH/FimT family pseudopilin [Gemmatimonadaceae bacterium]
MLSQFRRRGFTIIDVIVTTGLLGVVTAFGAPELQQALRHRTVQGAADQFTTAHSLARATAIRYGRVAQLHIDPATRRFWIEADTSADDIGQRATIWYERSLTEPGVQMSSDRTVLCFDARGLGYDVDPCQSGDAEVVFSTIDASDTVRTTVLGKVLR